MAARKNTVRDARERAAQRSVLVAALILNLTVAAFFLWLLFGRKWQAPLDPSISQEGQFDVLSTLLSNAIDIAGNFAFATAVSMVAFAVMACMSPMRGMALSGLAVLLGGLTAALALAFAPSMEADPGYWTKVGDGVSYLFPATVYGHVILIQFILVLITAVLVEVLGVRHGWVASN